MITEKEIKEALIHEAHNKLQEIKQLIDLSIGIYQSSLDPDCHDRWKELQRARQWLAQATAPNWPGDVPVPVAGPSQESLSPLGLRCHNCGGHGLEAYQRADGPGPKRPCPRCHGTGLEPGTATAPQPVTGTGAVAQLLMDVTHCAICGNVMEVEPGPLRIYLAARYSRRLELCQYREQLRSLGYQVQARWLDGGHQIADDGKPIGDNGEALVEGTVPGAGTVAAELRAKFAQDDWEDVCAADIVVSFTEVPRGKPNRGGRHVEFGIALARGARCIVVGHRENIFHWLPKVEFHATWQEALTVLTNPKP